MAEQDQQEGALVEAARTIGGVIGKAAAALGVKSTATTPTATPAKAAKPQPENLYKAEYIGSGTFIISKPKRNRRKLHQTRVKSGVRGARK